jgi:hypothetical protein
MWSLRAPVGANANRRSRYLIQKRTFRQVLTVCLLVYMFSAKGYIEVSDTSLSLQTAQAIVTHGQSYSTP